MRSSLDGRGATCRSPHGERGLKYAGDLEVHVGLESLSSRRAWIEIGNAFCTSPPVKSLSSRRAWIEIQARSASAPSPDIRSPHEERGLKYDRRVGEFGAERRSPHGERGLKCKRAGGTGRKKNVALLTESVD